MQTEAIERINEKRKPKTLERFKFVRVPHERR